MRQLRNILPLVLLACLYAATIPSVATGQAVSSLEQNLASSHEALRQQHYAEAIRLLEAGLKRYPGEPALKVELGRACLYDHQDRRAVRLFREVLIEEPSNRQAKLELARALGYQRNYRDSDRLYRELLTSNPKDEAASAGLVRNLIEQDRGSEAHAQLELSLAEQPDNLRLREYQTNLHGHQAEVGDREAKRNRLYASEDFFSDSSGNRSLRSEQQLDSKLFGNLANRVQSEERYLWTSGGPHAKVLWGTDQLRYRLTNYLLIGAGGGAVRFDDSRGRALYRAELEFHPVRQFWLTGGFGRNPIDPTVQAAQFDLLGEGWFSRLDWNPGLWQVNANWSRQHYSDGNLARREGAEVLRWMGSSRLGFAAGYRFNHLNFSQNFAHGYFDPSKYQSHLGIAGVRFLRKSFRGEYLGRVGEESVSGSPYSLAWEVTLRNHWLIGNWEIGGDYFYYHVAQSTGAFRAHAPRLILIYHF